MVTLLILLIAANVIVLSILKIKKSEMILPVLIVERTNICFELTQIINSVLKLVMAYSNN
jgi:hypothetical protein